MTGVTGVSLIQPYHQEGLPEVEPQTKESTRFDTTEAVSENHTGATGTTSPPPEISGRLNFFA